MSIPFSRASSRIVTPDRPLICAPLSVTCTSAICPLRPNLYDHILTSLRVCSQLLWHAANGRYYNHICAPGQPAIAKILLPEGIDLSKNSNAPKKDIMKDIILKLHQGLSAEAAKDRL